MDMLHATQLKENGNTSERLGAMLTPILNLFEEDWRQRRQIMSAEEQRLVREVHRALGKLKETQ